MKIDTIAPDVDYADPLGQAAARDTNKREAA